MNLFVSTQVSQLFVMDSECPTCFSNDSYAPSFSQTSEDIKDATSTTPFYKYEWNSQKIQKFSSSIILYYDLVNFLFRESSDHMQKGIGLKIYDIIHTIPDFTSRYDDGVLGLAPHAYYSEYPQNNFMQQLYQFEAIGNNVFSIFPNSGEGELTHIKFGGWDQVGMVEGEKLSLVHTTKREDWTI